MKIRENAEKNPETGYITGKENIYITFEKETIHSVKKSEDLMKNPETGKKSIKRVSSYHI